MINSKNRLKTTFDMKKIFRNKFIFSGLSGEVLDEQGHFWIGMDISPSMLKIADEREVEGDLILGDMGDGLPFKAGE